MIIVIANNKGGAGKTTTAFNLAKILKPEYVVDLDFQHSITALNDVKNANLNVMSFDGQRELATFLVTNKNQLIIVDCGGFDSDLSNIALAAADHILVPSRENTLDMKGLISTNETLRRINKKALVFSNDEHHFKKNHKTLQGLIERLDNLSLMSDRCRVPRGKGASNLIMDKNNTFLNAYKQICKEIGLDNV